jgi:hypothetical protein
MPRRKLPRELVLKWRASAHTFRTLEIERVTVSRHLWSDEWSCARCRRRCGAEFEEWRRRDGADTIG